MAARQPPGKPSGHLHSLPLSQFLPTFFLSFSFSFFLFLSLSYLFLPDFLLSVSLLSPKVLQANHLVTRTLPFFLGFSPISFSFSFFLFPISFSQISCSLSLFSHQKCCRQTIWSLALSPSFSVSPLFLSLSDLFLPVTVFIPHQKCWRKTIWFNSPSTLSFFLIFFCLSFPFSLFSVSPLSTPFSIVFASSVILL